MIRRRLYSAAGALILILLTTGPLMAVSDWGTFTPQALTDMTPDGPLANPDPAGYQPRYISGFGQDNAFTVFFEDRDAGYTISFVQTTTGPAGFPASPTATNVADTHFCVKDWPINIGGIDYAYRAWGAVGNNPDHHFYVSNDLITWTLVSTFTIPNAVSFTDALGFVYYGFHDVIRINGTYYAFAESNQSQTMLVRSASGDDVWEAFAAVGGPPGNGPLGLPAGVVNGWTPTGNFFDLGHDRGMGKLYADPRNSAFYLAVNTAARASLPPSDLEAAFIDPANWTWHDGTAGPAAAPVLSSTAEHDLRETWLVPQTDPDAPWVILYDADYGSADGNLALGWFSVAPEAPPGPPSTPVPVPLPAAPSGLSLAMSAAPDAAVVGAPVLWVISVSNPGSDALADVLVTDSLPPAFAITGVTASQGEAVWAGQEVAVTVGALEPGQTVTITIESLSNEETEVGTVCNTAWAGDISAVACMLLFPPELPLTGGSLANMFWPLLLLSLLLLTLVVSTLALRPMTG